MTPNFFSSFDVCDLLLSTGKVSGNCAAAFIEGRKIRHNLLNVTLSWPSLQARKNCQNCMLVYKCLNNVAQAYLINEFRCSSQVHHCNTRSRDLLRLPLARTAKYQSSFPATTGQKHGIPYLPTSVISQLCCLLNRHLVSPFFVTKHSSYIFISMCLSIYIYNN